MTNTLRNTGSFLPFYLLDISVFLPPQMTLKWLYSEVSVGVYNLRLRGYGKNALGVIIDQRESTITVTIYNSCLTELLSS